MALEDLLRQIAQWMQEFSIQYGYLGVFLMSSLGSTSIFFPIPYTVVLFTIGSIKNLNPLLVALSSSMGSAIGEFSGYLLGLGSRKILSDERKHKMEFLVKIIERIGPVVIFLFSLTPLPDDLLFIPLGVMRYKFFKAFIPAFLGKLCMCMMIVYSAGIFREALRVFFGVESDWISALISMIVAIVLTILIFLIMLKVDWEKFFEKHVLKKDA